jgi:hypothetical protein
MEELGKKYPEIGLVAVRATRALRGCICNSEANEEKFTAMWQKRIAHFCGDHSRCDWSKLPCANSMYIVHPEAQQEFRVTFNIDINIDDIGRKGVKILRKQYRSTNCFLPPTQ